MLPVLGQATATSLYGQSRGEIRLHVKDSTGHPLQTRGTLYGPVAGTSRAVDSAADGSITIPDLAFGRYQLALAQTGFASQTINFQVQSSTPITRDVTLRRRRRLDDRKCNRIFANRHA